MGKIKYSVGLPKLSHEETLVIYDRRLLKTKDVEKWIGKLPNTLGVKAGEGLKDLEGFSLLVQKVLKKVKDQNAKQLKIVAVGGGSVGDAVGFLASVLKRGVQLIHIPSTWLAAIDSAHGGKTALNVNKYKNQIGSFYQPKEVYVSKKLLSTQTDLQLRSAYGELLKIALINGGRLSREVLQLKKLDTNQMWSVLPLAVNAKLKIVKQDPLEKKKVRFLLNLGHSFGHALELEKSWPHGEAVLSGTLFSLRWSLHKGYLSQATFDKIEGSLLVSPRPVEKIASSKLKALLLQDKKSAGKSRMSFVFVDNIGSCKVKTVEVEDIIAEAGRQGWLK